MTNAPALIRKIHEEFGSIPFPTHCGLYAAMAMDDWISDETELRKITLEKDYIGEWWDVPLEHLKDCLHYSLCYLDSSGVEFYLPAYMVALLRFPEQFDYPKCSSAWSVIIHFRLNDDDDELREYSRDKFSRIDGGKKRVCREFLQYVAACPLYNNHAAELAKEALENDFWAVDN
mgnify:FL=1